MIEKKCLLINFLFGGFFVYSEWRKDKGEVEVYLNNRYQIFHAPAIPFKAKECPGILSSVKCTSITLESIFRRRQCQDQHKGLRPATEKPACL